MAKKICSEERTLWDFLETDHKFDVAPLQWVKFRVVDASGSGSVGSTWWRAEEGKMLVQQHTEGMIGLQFGTDYTMKWEWEGGDVQSVRLFVNVPWEGGEPKELATHSNGYQFPAEFTGHFEVERGSDVHEGESISGMPQRVQVEWNQMNMMKNVIIQAIDGAGAQAFRCACLNGQGEVGPASACFNGYSCASCNDGYTLNDQKICEVDGTEVNGNGGGRRLRGSSAPR